MHSFGGLLYQLAEKGGDRALGVFSAAATTCILIRFAAA